MSRGSASEDEGSSSPPPVPGDRFVDHPVLTAMLIAVLAGLLLQMSNIAGFQEFLDSNFANRRVLVLLFDFAFRMAMGALLVLLALPALLGLVRRGSWFGDYASLLRLSTRESPSKTAAVAIQATAAFLFVVIAFSVGAGVFRADLGVLVEEENWLIFLWALIPGIWEELTFRGVVLSGLQQRFSPMAAVTGSSIVFGLFHLSNLVSWDDSESVLASVIAAMTLGLAWAYMTLKTNSVLPAIINHYVVDVVLFLEVFIDPAANDDSTTIVYLAVVILYPTLTILLTKRLFPASSTSS